MENKPVEIFILSGFLGSGKSTLLKELIQLEKKVGRRIGVLMNELGDISIDSSIIPADIPLKEMLNGCICCTIQGELSLQLNSILEEYDLDAIYIEATGVAHPLEIMDACTHPKLANKVVMKAILTVVNAKQWHENRLSIKLKKLLAEQVKYADMILINKIDQVSQTELELIRESIGQVNAKAIISSVQFGKIHPSLLYGEGQQQMETATKLLENDHHESHVHHHLHVRTFSVPVNQPIDRIQFTHWLERIQGQLYRAKGFIYLTETPGLFLFNYAYGDLILERYPTEKPLQPVLVCIGENLERESIEQGISHLQQSQTKMTL
ncbi:CobW family GTP-binding protein [Halalkalibacter alkalisediminis]|uniref:CobW family GTP-binding protein n=1 Tax=Halalkalibacter alkalisediminis TaxID=935616 RepID=A0ABV6NDR9_9BACI|nr:GTP-binding protein [Halalkalibacter alkalisediminis]